MCCLLVIDWDYLLGFWPQVTAILATLLTVIASAHVVLRKRDTRAAIGWVGVIWLAPLLGSALYLLFGINRIRRRARGLRTAAAPAPGDTRLVETHAEAVHAKLDGLGRHLWSLARLVGELTGRPLLSGNRITPLVNGLEAYPQMLAAIDSAQRSVALCTYIFNHDTTGARFVETLARAAHRNVQVRVLVDSIGARYKWPTVLRALRRAGVPCATFLPAMMPGWFPYANLRSHRKILVVDGTLGFTGGMNIRESDDGRPQGNCALQDLHCRVEGPVVAHLQQVFAEDWEFATGQRLEGETWFPPLAGCGPVVARGIADGPDENHDKLRLTYLGALACAQQSVQIVTPYFLPDAALITALNVCRMQGLEVDILLPAQNNLSLVQWASTAQLWQVLERGCRVWLTPPPFDHTKLMVVDGAWSLIGSGNWDPRSFRLNFEFNIECYDAELAHRFERLVQAKLARARQVTLAEVDGRSLPVRLRDGIARLFSPYL